MIPGTVSKLSRATVASTTTIYPKSDLIRVTGTEAIETITPAFGGQFAQVLFIVPVGAFITVTTGNIALAATAVASRLMTLCFDPSTALWYPSYTS